MKKEDEMGMYINFQAMRIAYSFINAFLLIWIFYDFLKFRNIGLPLILTLSQGIVFFGSKLFITWKMNKDEK